MVDPWTARLKEKEEKDKPSKKESDPWKKRAQEREIQVKEEPSKAKSLFSSIGRGIIKARESIPSMLPSMFPLELKERLFKEEFPILPEHEPVERGSKIATEMAAFPASLPMRAAETLIATALGELGKEEGLGEAGQGALEALGLGVPGIAKAAKQVAAKVGKAIPEKMPSGLTKLKAQEAKFPKLASASKERQQIVIDRLNKEASKIAKSSVEKHVPFHKELEKGIDIEGNLKKEFQNLKTSAEKANPRVDITPVVDLIDETASKYRGIPSPNPDAKKVIKELRAFKERPQTGLKNLLKIYRDNNKKMKHIFETSFVSGRQQEYVDFLVDMNKSIAKSFEKTLPEESQWLTDFKRLNADHKKLRNAEKITQQLKGVLSEKPTASQIDKLASDVRTQRKLALTMGDKGSQEIVQLAKDLKSATESIKKMSKSDFSKFSLAFPVFFLLPWLVKYLGVYKGVEVGRHAYGIYLSRPATKEAFKDAVKALSKKDLDGYKRATAKLAQELKKEED